MPAALFSPTKNQTNPYDFIKANISKRKTRPKFGNIYSLFQLGLVEPKNDHKPLFLVEALVFEEEPA